MLMAVQLLVAPLYMDGQAVFKLAVTVLEKGC